MKKIDGHFCRVYGSENTHLTLTRKADEFYSMTDPYHIYECEAEGENGETVYLYATRGFTDSRDWMTEAELNEMLEAEADEIAVVEDEDGNEIRYAAAVELMDDDLREEIHAELAPCSNQEFFDEYCRRHAEKFGEDFKVN